MAAMRRSMVPMRRRIALNCSYGATAGCVKVKTFEALKDLAGLA
jgi:hypothetical protein